MLCFRMELNDTVHVWYYELKAYYCVQYTVWCHQTLLVIYINNVSVDCMWFSYCITVHFPLNYYAYEHFIHVNRVLSYSNPTLVPDQPLAQLKFILILICWHI